MEYTAGISDDTRACANYRATITLALYDDNPTTFAHALPNGRLAKIYNIIL